MERLVRTGLLYDFYGGLLTAKQQKIMELYFLENWSLAEIADAEGVSRQAVHDLLQRSEKIVEGFEAKLGLLERYTGQQASLIAIRDKILKIMDRLPDKTAPVFRELSEINKEILRLIESETE